MALHGLAPARPVRWIGVDFDATVAGDARMRLPPEFLRDLSEQVSATAAAGGRISDSDANRLIGRAARVAFVVPAAAPFAAALRAALFDARQVASASRGHGQRSSHSCVRFAVAAAWFRALLSDLPVDGRTQMPLERVVSADRPPALVAGQCDALVFDASPWGGGVVRFSGSRPVETLTLKWSEDLCRRLGVRSGESRFLPFFEALTALIALVRWGGPGGLKELALVGDNLGALTAAVSQKGKGDVARVCREFALRQARWGTVIAVGHLPSALNTWADALSRVFAPSPPAIPPELAVLPVVQPPSLDDVFCIALAGGQQERE